MQAPAGAAETISVPMPAGRVGLWCGAATGYFDYFRVWDLAGPFEVDVKWFSDRAKVRVDDSI